MANIRTGVMTWETDKGQIHFSVSSWLEHDEDGIDYDTVANHGFDLPKDRVKWLIEDLLKMLDPNMKK